MRICRYLLIFSCFGIVTAEYSVSLEEVSTVFLPEGTRKWDVQVAQSASYDHHRKLLYVVGGRYRHVIDYSNPKSPDVLRERENTLVDGDVTDISVCGEYFIQTTDNKAQRSKGVIEIYKRFDASKEPERLYTTEVGGDPGSVRFLPGCKEAVVTVKGSANKDNGQFKDPKGKVIFVQLPVKGYSGTFQNNVKLVTLDFTKFDSKVNDLKKNGTRHVYRANGNPFSNDVDPVSITLSHDGKKVFVALQVTNAVAVVDVATKSITHVHGLGMKDWKNLTMDASDKDNGINMKKWPIFSYYLPNGIGHMRHGTKSYIVTANEGDSYDYSDFINFNEEKRGKDFIKDDLVASSVSTQMKGWLANDLQLGRLQFTTSNGEDTVNSYTKFVGFGGRSFSIRDAETMQLVYDSGDDLENTTAELNPHLFNGDVDDGHTPQETADENSDKRGPEPKSIAIGALGRLGLIFVGAESSNTVHIYSVLDDIKKPRFESMWHGLANTTAITWDDLFKTKKMKGVDPEYLSFLDEKKSPTKKPALFMIGAGSSSMTLFNVKLSGKIPPPSTSSAKGVSISGLWMWMILLIPFLLRF